MQFTVEDVNSVKKVLHIEVPVEKITGELNRAYTGLQKTAKIKGFRPGKAPRSVLEKVYRKDVEADVTSRLIQDSFVDVLKETGLKPIGGPRIIPPVLVVDAPYAYDATVEIRPEIADIDFKGIELKKSNYQVTDAVVDSQLTMFQQSLTQKLPIKEARPVREGDFALIDYVGFKDGEAFEGAGKTENFTLKVGDGQIHADLDAGLVGMNVNDAKEITVTFAEDDKNKTLAGKTILFKVTLKEIREDEVPVLDDEFAKKLGKFDSLDALRETVRKNLTDEYAKRTEQELSEQVATALLGKTDFEVPEAMIQYELEGIVAETERSFAYHNMSLKETGMTREFLMERSKEPAEKQARRHLILSKIVAQEKLTLADEELDEPLKEMAAAYRQPFETVKNYILSQEDKLAYLKENLLEKKAMKLVLEHAKVEEISAPIEDAVAE